MRKIYLRLLPFAILSYFLAYIDRINVSFAALTMRGDLNISAGDYGFALGTFYWGYFLFEVPSNVILEKVGARLWIARIMITWGILAGLTALVTGTTSFGIIRFLLGVAEGVPTVLVGLLTLFVLTDRPAQAKFLTAAEKEWLTAKLAAERAAKEAVHKFSLMEAFFNPKVLLLALNYFGIVVASLGILFFVPQIIKSIGVTDNMTVGWLTMIPYISGGVGLVTWGLVSDRMNERRWNLLAACVVSAIGLVIAGLTIGSWWAMVGLSIANFGFYGSKGPFWSMPPMFMTGTAAAASIAWINSIGNLGGFFGPWYVGVIKDWTGSYAGGLYGLAFLCLISAVVCALFLDIPNPAAARTRVAA